MENEVVSKVNEEAQNANDIVDSIFENMMESADNGSKDASKSNEYYNIDRENPLKRIDYYVQTANAKILLDTLAPEVSENEKKKREHKDLLIKYVSIFLGAQFLIIFILVMLVIISIISFHAKKNDFSTTTIQMLFAFFGTYITSVIVELIYILKYIVLKVFDTSISGLMETFKSQSKKDKEQED